VSDTHTQIDTAWRHRPRLCIASRGINAIPREWRETPQDNSRWIRLSAVSNFCRAMLCKHSRSPHAVSVPSITFVHSVKTNKHTFRFFHHRVAKPFKFFRIKRHGNIPTDPPPLTGASNASGMKARFSTSISLYLETMQDRAIVTIRRRIGNRTQAFEWYQFQWLLTQISRSRYYWTSNNSKMVQHRVICIWSIERRHFQWPWKHPLFQAHVILWRWVFHKRYEIVSTEY